ncbi:MAG: hypothetical protein OEY09_09960 [Gammaproteobacteria bacterium]|nr:hypothetical protein [Gammaproteobacteria bacterium]
MIEYLIAITLLVLLIACWAAFQLWIGQQADGTPTNCDERSCHGCGGTISNKSPAVSVDVSVPKQDRN